jgi:cysteine desulfurase family protein (TIGR01976 family)
MITGAYPIEQVRSQFPALKRTYHDKAIAYFDGPGGSQVCQGAIDAVARFMTNGVANRGGMFPTSADVERVLAEGRQAVADLFGSEPEEVAFGPNMTTLTFNISRAIARDWRPGDEIVVSEMDHYANVDSWSQAAEDKGATVRWLKVNPDTLTLDISNLESLINSKTRLVAVGLASNVTGTINDVARISARAKAVGAVMAVDAVHAAPHIAIDREKLNADILLSSAYKFFGPHVGMAVIRKSVFEGLRTYRVSPSHNDIPDRLETGTQNFEGIAGVPPAIEFIAGLGTGSTRRERIMSGYAAIEAHENSLGDMLREKMAAMHGVTLYQAAPEVPKVPTIAFRVEGASPEDLVRWMAEQQSVFISGSISGEDYYARSLAQLLNIGKLGGWNRIGLAAYNTQEECERFLSGLEEFVRR